MMLNKGYKSKSWYIKSVFLQNIQWGLFCMCDIARRLKSIEKITFLYGGIVGEKVEKNIFFVYVLCYKTYYRQHRRRLERRASKFPISGLPRLIHALICATMKANFIYTNCDTLLYGSEMWDCNIHHFQR